METRAFDTLYERIAGLVVACACSISIAWACAIISGLIELQIVAVVFTVVATARVVLCLTYSKIFDMNGRRSLRNAVRSIAIIYAIMVGVLGMAVLLLPVSGDLRVLAVGYVMVFTTAIAVRGASRPTIALFQSLLAMTPVFVACLIIASPAMLVLAFVLPGLMFGIRSLTWAVNATLAEQYRIAEGYREVSSELRQQATHDTLTGLLNRAGIESALAAMDAALAGEDKVALLWLDLHRLRDVNESLGYSAGDKLLCEMARRLRRTAKSDAIMGRFASDEFIVAVPIASRMEAERLVAAISAELVRPTRIEGSAVESGTSIGVALLHEDADSLVKLMQAADLALLHAKANGRNQVCFFNPEMNRQRVQRKEIESDLREALSRNELSIYFQPLVDLKTGQIRCFEALARWFHPEKGELPPDLFIPVAEETGQIITLGNWITATAARAAAQWPDHVSVAVNLSPVQIRAPGAALGILTALREAGLDPKRLELEVTESLFLEDDESTRLFMEQLGEVGVRFALDDFGTGYSSLNYIHKYPFKKIKVDRSFVSGPNTGPKSDAIIRAVAEMGATLGMEIVAEGIETIDQVHTVCDAGCTLGQGYYFSRAVPDFTAAYLLAQEDYAPGSARLAG